MSQAYYNVGIYTSKR